MQMVTRESDYAIRALTLLGANGGYVRAARIAEEKAVPFDFLQKILRKLKSAEFVAVKRGPGGGFTLVRSPADIRLLDVLDVIQGPLTVSQCLLGDHKCPLENTCPVRNRLAAIQGSVRESLAEITLSELLESSEDNTD
jgi:Rrf2 family protein